MILTKTKDLINIQLLIFSLDKAQKKSVSKRKNAYLFKHAGGGM